MSIPVKLYTTTETADAIAFRMLHEPCKTPLKRPYWCPKCQEMVDHSAIVKGYEYAKDNFALMTDEEIKAVAEEVTRTVDIAEFVPLAQLDPVYYDSAYWLGPGKGGERPYKLLSIALEKTGLAGVAKYAARGKQYLVVIRPKDEGLVLQQLRYVNEVRPFSEVPIEEGIRIKPAEVKLALQLIEQTAVDTLDLSKYEDEVKGRLQEVIQQKIEGHEVTLAAGVEPKAQVLDLMEALKQSLGAAGKTAKKKAPGAGERKPAKASPRKKATKAKAKKTAGKKTASG